VRPLNGVKLADSRIEGEQEAGELARIDRQIDHGRRARERRERDQLTAS
jgi:hypothetical protein